MVNTTKIKHLSLDQAHKIAAGEVVERPANIVKELLENSIDAGATTISLYIEDGGKKLIRVIDNGCGMSPADARICFDKHATSKLNSIDELESIHTFGFRGEALASVAAIAHVTLITKEAEPIEGTKLTITNSALISEEPIAAPTGTDIAVSDLFYAIPARKKFLKKRETEWRHIQQLFQAFCLDYPDIHFKLYSEGKLFYNCPPTASLRDRFASVCEFSSAATMIEITGERLDHTITISGVISDHHTMRFDRAGIFFFVNKRWIKNHELARALIKGYQNVIPHGRYPLACISISIDPKNVDINIHPRKEEVKFMHPGVIENAITLAVKEGLEKQLSRQIKREVKFATDDFSQPAFQEQKNYIQNIHASPYVAGDQISFANKESTTRRYTDSSSLGTTSVFAKACSFAKALEDRPLDKQGERLGILNTEINTNSILFSTQNNFEQSKVKKINSNSLQETPPTDNLHILCQYQKTYILIEQESGLLFIDQHAAHERVLYEEFRSNFENIATVSLLFPQLISFASHDIGHLEPHLAFLNQQGIHIEIFGEDQLKITAIPVHLKNASIEELLGEMLTVIHEHKTVDAAELAKLVHEKTHAQMACKAAVKAGDVLSREQMKQLIKDLYKTANRFSCPHGRPTSFTLPLDDLEKKFKRDYRTY